MVYDPGVLETFFKSNSNLFIKGITDLMDKVLDQGKAESGDEESEVRDSGEGSPSNGGQTTDRGQRNRSWQTSGDSSIPGLIQ